MRAAANASLAWAWTPGVAMATARYRPTAVAPAGPPSANGHDAGHHGERPALEPGGHGQGRQHHRHHHRGLQHEVDQRHHRLDDPPDRALGRPVRRLCEGPQPAEQGHDHDGRQRAAPEARRQVPVPPPARGLGPRLAGPSQGPQAELHRPQQRERHHRRHGAEARVADAHAERPGRQPPRPRPVGVGGLHLVAGHVVGVVGVDADGRPGREHVGRVEEGAAAPAGDLLGGADLLLGAAVAVAGVVVEVAGHGQLRHDAGRAQDGPLQVGEVPVGGGVAVEPGPGGDRGGQDQPVPGLGPLRHPGEVLELGLVDEAAGLDVDAPQPPVVRQLHGPVAAGLVGPPAADPAALAEQAQEPGEPVEPVVVAGDGVQRRVGRRGPRQGRPPRALQPALVVVGAGRRVHLVAPEHEDVAPGQAPVEALGPQLAAADGGRHGGRGLEAVAGVGHVVDPHLVVGRVAQVGYARAGGLQLALVEERPEHRGHAHVQRRRREHPGAEPAHGGPGREPQLAGVEALRPGRGHVLGGGQPDAPGRARVGGVHPPILRQRRRVP